MLIKVHTLIFLEVEDEEEGEAACSVIGSSSMREAMRGFPHGEVLGADVERFEAVNPQEAEQRGLTE